MELVRSFQVTACVVMATSGMGLGGGAAQARELYNRDTGKAAIPLTPAHEQCNQAIFGGTILAETINPSLRQTPEQQAAADERVFNCMRTYGNAATAVMMVASYSKTDPQACKLYLYTIRPGQTATARTLGRELLDCTSSRPSSPYGHDPEAAFSLDAIWPAEGAAIPGFLYEEFGPTIRRVSEAFHPAFLEFDRDDAGAARGIHGYADINTKGGSIGCVRLTPEHATELLERFDQLNQQWRPLLPNGKRDDSLLPEGWWRHTPVFFTEQAAQTTR